MLWQKINSKTEDWTVFVRSYCTMVEGNTKNMHFYLVTAVTPFSQQWVTTFKKLLLRDITKEEGCIGWYSLRKHACNQKGIRQKAYKRVQIWGQGCQQHQTGLSVRYSGPQNARKDCY